VGRGLVEKIKKFFTMEDELSSSGNIQPVAADSGLIRKERPRGTIISLPQRQKAEIVIVEPNSFGEAREIAEILKQKKSIIINMRKAEKELARRIIDFLSGISCAIDGHVQQITETIFLFTPGNIEVVTPFRKEKDRERICEEDSLLVRNLTR
jgi:cell division inhibitor SepF